MSAPRKPFRTGYPVLTLVLPLMLTLPPVHAQSSPLNDTGITFSGDGTVCESTAASTQDCHNGRDAAAVAAVLTKIGANIADIQSEVIEAVELKSDDGVNSNQARKACTDTDADGWSTCDADCCDQSGTCDIPPELVNPGALEILGNGVDDDCDAVTSDTTLPAVCSTSESYSADPNQLAAALGLCQFTTASPPITKRTWGLISAELLNPDGSVPSSTELFTMQNKQTGVLTSYGDNILPRHGATMLGLSSGVMRDPGDPGYAGASTNHNRAGLPPTDFLTAHGGQLPSFTGCRGFCPHGTGANDGVNLRLTIRVPTNIGAFQLWQRFFVADYSQWQCSKFNDFLLILLDSSHPAIPADGNVSFDAIGNPLSLNNAFFEVCTAQDCNTCPSGSTDLDGTGLEMIGGGTSWHSAFIPVVAGETIILEVMVFDVSDRKGDVIGLVDQFAWVPLPSTHPEAIFRNGFENY